MTLVKRITLVAGVIVLVALSSYIVLKTETDNKNSPKSKLEDESIKSIILDRDVTGNTAVIYIDTPYVKEYSLPNGTWPNGILVDRNGMVWLAGSRSHTLTSFDPMQKHLKSYPITEETTKNNNFTGGSLMVWAMVEDNDGFIWFSQFGPNPLWRFDPKTEKFQVFHSLSAPPFQMKVDEETGNIWFTTLTGNTIGVIQKTENKSDPVYTVTEFDVGQDTYPSGLFLEKHHVWIALIQNHKLVKFNVRTDNNGLVVDVVRVLEIPSDDKIFLYSPTDLFVLDDNSIWFTEHGTSTITNYQKDSHTMVRFPTSANPYQATTLPFWIRESVDGDGLWFNEHTGNKIAFLNTTNTMLIEYEIPTRPLDGYIVYPLGIATDPADSKKLWFSEWNTDKIAVVDRSIPISFDISSDVTRVVLDNGNNTANIDMEIVKNNDANFLVNNKNNILHLRVSSSMEPAAGLVNMTANFSEDTIDLTKIKETLQVSLSLQNNIAPTGNYTLVISATDGTVTKSIFLDLEID